MAWLQQDPSRNFHISFRFGGTKFKRSLRTQDEQEAQARKATVEENIRLAEAGRIQVPAEADLPIFLLSNGRLSQKAVAPTSLTLSEFFNSFFESLPEGNLEDSTLYSMHVHERHLIRLLGKSFRVQSLTLADLQTYVRKRSREDGIRGRNVGANTISKEIATFRTVWNWALDMNHLKGEFPRNGLRLPKTIEKPPFQTWDEIQRHIDRGGLSEVEQKDLWDCLYLNLDEIEQLLQHVERAARQPFIYPMFVMAAHTGARRSELLRSQLCDFDGAEVVIRERKGARGKHTVRRVPMSSLLRQAIDRWLNEHPGGNDTFCQTDVARSKKSRSLPEPVTRDEANCHLRRTLRNSKWQTIRGWHCLRHSFCSNCAAAGIDQRIIDSLVGHTTEAMSRRYRHLFPDNKKQAITNVFG